MTTHNKVPTPAAPEPSHADLIKFARFTQKFYKEGQEIMRKHNLCIDNLDDNMQKLAFTFYSSLCEIDSKARHLFQESYGEENYVDERLPAGVTYSPEHDATIRNDERNKTLDEAIKELQEILENPNKPLPWKIAPLSQTILLLESLRTNTKDERHTEAQR